MHSDRGDIEFADVFVLIASLAFNFVPETRFGKPVNKKSASPSKSGVNGSPKGLNISEPSQTQTKIST